jgi:hypothetical protein
MFKGGARLIVGEGESERPEDTVLIRGSGEDTEHVEAEAEKAAV